MSAQPRPSPAPDPSQIPAPQPYPAFDDVLRKLVKVPKSAVDAARRKELRRKPQSKRKGK